MHPAAAPGRGHPRVPASAGPQEAREAVLPNEGEARCPLTPASTPSLSLLSLQPGGDGVKPSVALPPCCPLPPSSHSPQGLQPPCSDGRGWAAPIRPAVPRGRDSVHPRDEASPEAPSSTHGRSSSMEIPCRRTRCRGSRGETEALARAAHANPGGLLAPGRLQDFLEQISSSL